jgi:hypothetical protein
MTSSAMVAADDVYRCPAGEMLTYRYTNEEDGKTLHRYWTTACQTCALKARCTPGKERRISRWEHEAVLETVQDRLDRNPDKMRVRRQTVEHPFGTIKAWMGATHSQMRRLPKVASEMALHVLAYNMKRVMQISDGRHAGRPAQMTTGRNQGSQGSIPENSPCRSVKSSPASPRQQSGRQLTANERRAATSAPVAGPVPRKTRPQPGINPARTLGPLGSHKGIDPSDKSNGIPDYYLGSIKTGRCPSPTFTNSDTGQGTQSPYGAFTHTARLTNAGDVIAVPTPGHTPSHFVGQTARDDGAG